MQVHKVVAWYGILRISRLPLTYAQLQRLTLPQEKPNSKTSFNKANACERIPSQQTGRLQCVRVPQSCRYERWLRVSFTLHTGNPAHHANFRKSDLPVGQIDRPDPIHLARSRLRADLHDQRLSYFRDSDLRSGIRIDDFLASQRNLTPSQVSEARDLINDVIPSERDSLLRWMARESWEPSVLLMFLEIRRFWQEREMWWRMWWSRFQFEAPDIGSFASGIDVDDLAVQKGVSQTSSTANQYALSRREMKLLAEMRKVTDVDDAIPQDWFEEWSSFRAVPSPYGITSADESPNSYPSFASFVRYKVCAEDCRMTCPDPCAFGLDPALIQRQRQLDCARDFYGVLTYDPSDLPE